MKRQAIIDAEKEAKRFLEKAVEFHRMDRDIPNYSKDTVCQTSKEAASLKRSSMDLTRALTNLRKI
jgi:hypothetical protein